LPLFFGGEIDNKTFDLAFLCDIYMIAKASDVIISRIDEFWGEKNRVLLLCN